MKDEALRLALEALELALRCHGVMLLSDPPKDAWKYHGVEANANQAITAIKAALEAKDEPDKYAMDIECTKCGAKQSGVLTVHTTPPQRKPLTDEEIKRIWESLPFCNGAWETFARAIEAAHGIKGEAK